MSRNYTAYKNGKVVRNGTFHDEALLRLDFPPDQYDLVLDELHYPDDEPVGYAELRRRAYPPEGEFADAMYWLSKGDGSKLDAYFAKVEAVKLQFPKV